MVRHLIVLVIILVSCHNGVLYIYNASSFQGRYKRLKQVQ